MKKCFALLLLLIVSNIAFSQTDEPLNIFGYFQSTYNYASGSKVVKANPVYNDFKDIPAIYSAVSPNIEINVPGRQNFIMAQLNLFFQKNYNEFTAFVNIEAKNSYNFEKNWGSYSIEEAWLRYTVSDLLKIKVGQMIPEFNNLNTVKNKTPFLPYILRPWVYEAQLAELLGIENFLPEQAFIQIYGKQNITESMSFDYAAYIGNAEASYHKSTVGGFKVKGEDTSAFKMVGGRIGIKYDNIKAGFSSTYDRDNQTNIFSKGGLKGDIPRIRLGGDLSFNVLGFSFESEIISVTHTLDDAQKNWLKSGYKNYLRNATIIPVITELGKVSALAAGTTDQRTLYLLNLQAAELQNTLKTNLTNYASSAISEDNMDKSFYYLTLGYNFTETLFAYGSYAYYQDQIGTVSRNGLDQLQVGLNFTTASGTVIKLSYTNYKFTDYEYKADNINASISVML
jgi:hypothetical protein